MVTRMYQIHIKGSTKGVQPQILISTDSGCGQTHSPASTKQGQISFVHPVFTSLLTAVHSQTHSHIPFVIQRIRSRTENSQKLTTIPRLINRTAVHSLTQVTEHAGSKISTDRQRHGATNLSEQKLSAAAGPTSEQEENMTENQANACHCIAAHTLNPINGNYSHTYSYTTK